MITSEVLIAYIQCSLKAFLLYCKKEKGISHEYTSILEEKARQNRVKHLNRIQARIQETEVYSSSGMKKGIPVLLEANLEFDGLAAYADVLTKVEELSSRKRYYYVPTLVVGTHKIYKEQKLELAFIGYVLSKLQKKKSDTGILVGWGDKSHTIKLEPFYKEVEQAIRKLKTWTSSQQTEEISIILNKYCHYCQFRQGCVSKAKEQDNLSLLNRISESEINALKKRGIFTVNQYSYTYRPRKRRKDKENQSPKYYHSLQALAIRENKIYIAEKAEIRHTTTQMFLDVEGIPDQDFYYLIGLLIVERDSTKKFSYWADNQNEEEKNWRDFLGIVTQYGEFSLFHYGKYEIQFIERMNKRYGFTGVLVSDFYPGYDTLDCHQQKCLIHLIRDLNEDFFKDQFNNELNDIVVNFGGLLRKIIDTVDRYGLKRRNLNKHNKDVQKFYKEIISKDYKTEIATSYQRRFLKNKEKLFTFLNYDGIPWNNNNAEHAIKPFAKFRRDADGVLTEKSINEYLILLSVQQTCKYRGISFLDFLRSQETSINLYSKKH